MRESDEKLRRIIESVLFGTVYEFAPKDLRQLHDSWYVQAISAFIPADEFESFRVQFTKTLISAIRWPFDAEFGERRSAAISKLVSPSSVIGPLIDSLLPEAVRVANGEEMDEVYMQPATANAEDIRQKLAREEQRRIFAPLSEPDSVVELPACAAAADETGEKNATLVRIFYATDRKRSPLYQILTEYRAERSEDGSLEFGECSVSIPACHKTGRLESPSILKLEFRPDPERHIVLDTVTTLDEDRFFEKVAGSVAVSPEQDAFIFVHGYNVTFKDAARRTGQFAYDLNFVGAPILYSWPANGKVFDYPADEANVIWTAPHFERFLTLIAERSGAKKIHVIAHSMGNRAVCDALKALSYRRPTNQGVLLHHLLLAAPDIDAGTFKEMASALCAMAGDITLYASAKDKAIALSQKLHKNPRAGAPPLLIIPGVTSIDASEMQTDFLAHSYFGDSWPLLSDIHSIITADIPAPKRFGLKETVTPEGLYYVFRA